MMPAVFKKERCSLYGPQHMTIMLFMYYPSCAITKLNITGKLRTNSSGEEIITLNKLNLFISTQRQCPVPHLKSK